MPLSPIATADGFRKVTISPANITVEAELVGDTLTLVAGTNVTLNADSTSDAVTINCGTAYGDIFINAENTNASRYMVFVHGTSGAQSTYIDTDLTYNPGTNTLSAAYYSGDGGSLTNITAGNLAGTIPSVVLGNSTVFIGTTGILLNRTSASQTLNGVSIDGNAATATKSTNLVGGNNTTLLGSLPYQSNTDTTALLSPNTTSTKKYLTMTGTGVNGAAPSWETIAAGDVPTLNQNTSGTAAGLSGSQTANTFYAGPSTGVAATATFRSIVAGDVPTLNQNTSGTATTATNLVGGNNTTLLGSLPYQSNTDTTTLLPPNIVATKKFLNMTGTGINGAAPSWDAVTASDVGLGNVTNESKATMFTNSTLTGSTQITSLGVGTPASGVTGEIRATNEITAYYASDFTLKENIEPITNALAKLEQITGVMFDWRKEVIDRRGGEDGYFVRKRDTGIIAQDVARVLPETVAERSDGTLAVKYEKLIGLIIEAVKELRAEVMELKDRL